MLLNATLMLLLAQADRSKLADAARTSLEWDSYGFVVRLVRGDAQVEGAAGFFEKGVGFYVKGEQELYRVGDKTVVRLPGGLWVPAPPQTRVMKPPHEEMAALENQFESLSFSRAGKGFVAAGPLTREGARRLLGEPAGLAPGDGDVTAKAKASVDRDGNITRVEIEGKTGGTGRKLSRIFEFKAIGKTKLNIPDEVKKALAAPASQSNPGPGRAPRTAGFRN
jgi:hypothetical protein